MMNKMFRPERVFTDCEEVASQLSDVTLLDLRRAEDFAMGHIAGAKHLDLYGVGLSNTAPEPLDAFLSMFDTLFGTRGVALERPVVVYDHESGERSARAAWLLAVLDHPDVRLLDGGSTAWIAAGLPLAQIESAPAHADPTRVPPTPPPLRGGRRMEWVATRFDIAQAIDDDNTVILDVRRRSEYVGAEKRARRVGTIPNAVHVFWREHLDSNDAMRTAEEVAALYESAGVTPDKNIIVFCQGGYRSASTFLALKALGYPNVSNYLGSWAEWGNRDDSRITVPAA